MAVLRGLFKTVHFQLSKIRPDFVVTIHGLRIRGVFAWVFHAKPRVKRRLPMHEEHLEWANASYYHSSEGTVNR